MPQVIEAKIAKNQSELKNIREEDAKRQLARQREFKAFLRKHVK